MSEAMKIPDPVADNQLKLNTAASAEFFATTGGTRTTILSNQGTGIFGAENPSSSALICGRPQRKTTTLRMIQGSQAWRTALVLWTWCFELCPSSSDILQIFLGVQNFRKTANAPIEVTAAITSTNHGPWKFETRNCGIAKHTPATRIAGQISSIPRKPANAQISQNGTSNEKNGNCRPTIALRSFSSRPVTLCSPMSGVPSAPKATGAVFAIN